MKIIKRNGSEVNFDENKILVAITKANESVPESDRMTELQIKRITESVVIACENFGRAPSVEEIQDLVEKKIMAHGAFEVVLRHSSEKFVTQCPHSQLRWNKRSAFLFQLSYYTPVSFLQCS